MKILSILTTIALLVSTACSTEPDVEDVSANEAPTFSPNEWPQKWQLVEMSGDMANTPPTTGKKMVWQESYVLFKDGRFVKTREWNKVTKESRGSYAVRSNNNEKYLELTHDVDNDLVGSCVSGPSETLHFTETTLTGTWLICDGPGLVYERVKYDGSSPPQ